MDVQVPLLYADLCSVRYILKSGATQSYCSCSSIFSFLRNLHTDFQSGCTILHSHPQYIRIPFSSHPLQHVLFVFLMIDILTSLKWILSVMVICIFSVSRDVGHFFMYLLVILRIVQFIYLFIDCIILLVFSFLSSSYILDITLLPDEQLADFSFILQAVSSFWQLFP
jgi:hypothetical protein